MTSPPQIIDDIAARLDRLPITSRHLLLFLIIGLGLIVDGFDLAITSAITAALVHEGATVPEVAPLATATAIGLALGAFLGGVAGDLIGRRVVIISAALLVAAALLGSALTPNFDQLVFWRGLTAFGLGVENVLAYGMLIEFLPLAVRGRWMARLAVVATVAAPLALLAGAYVAPLSEGWRVLLFVACALSTLTFMLRFLLPESARWLATRGRLAKASAIVARFERAAKHSYREPAPPLGDATTSATQAGAFWVRLALAAFINIALVCATLGFIAWLPTFFTAEGKDLPDALIVSSLITAGAPVGAFIGMLIIDAFERKWSAAVSAVAAAALAISYVLAPTSMLLVLGFLTVVAIYAYGAIALTSYMPELFTTSVRMRAIGAAITAGRVVAIALPSLIVVIYQTYGQAGVVALVATTFLILALALALFGARTRGRSLD